MKTTSFNNPFSLSHAFGHELLRSIIQFPAIYYTTGLKIAAIAARSRIVWYERRFAVRLSYRTLFMPMYGDYTRSGLIVGIFLRFFLALFRTLMFLSAVLLVVIAFALYGFAPLIVAYCLFNPPNLALPL